MDPAAVNDTPVLRTPRLELSFGTPEDAARLFPYVHGEGGRAVTDLLLWDGPAAPEEMSEFFEFHATGSFAEHGFHWVIRDRLGGIAGEGEAIGAIGMRATDDADRCDIGYWIGEPFWGKGLMAEAIAAVCDRAFHHWGFAAVVADVFAHNHRSIALLRKLGFVDAGTTPDYAVKRGCPVDGVHLELRRGHLRAPG